MTSTNGIVAPSCTCAKWKPNIFKQVIHLPLCHHYPGIRSLRWQLTQLAQNTLVN